jgi:hypothetical protein
MTMFQYDPPNTPQLFGAWIKRPGEVTYAVGGHPYSSPEQDCRKILDWFTRYPMLSDEQAVHDLKIANFRERIAHLRKRGYVIHGEGVLMEVTATRLHTSMVYALHHPIPVSAFLMLLFPLRSGALRHASMPIVRSQPSRVFKS